MTDKPTPSSLPEQLAAQAGMPTGTGDTSLRPDPAGLESSRLGRQISVFSRGSRTGRAVGRSGS
jgi:hypothetical protein